MGDFVAVRGDALPDAVVMSAWVVRALDYVAALPPKAATRRSRLAPSPSGRGLG